MAKIKIFCPHCGQSLQCDEGDQGKQVRCPPCGQLFLVPQMSLHATPNEAAKVQQSDAATAFRNDFFEKYPDLLPHESLVGNIAVMKMAQAIKASEYKGASDFLEFSATHSAWDVAVKLQASGYKGECREAVMEEFAKATRQELAPDIAFWKDFYETYPDLPPHESVVDAVTVKLKAGGYTGSREEVFETIAKAARQELARQQQSPPIVEVGQSDRAATSSQNSPSEGEWRRPTPEEVEDAWQEQQQRRLEQDRRDQGESMKEFGWFWVGGLVILLIYQAPTAALSWFLGFPVVWWIYRKIKKRYNG